MKLNEEDTWPARTSSSPAPALTPSRSTRPSPPSSATPAVTWARVAPDHVDTLLNAYRASLLGRLQELPGFCSLSLVVDRVSGRTVSVTSFESREALDRTRKEARSMREQFAQAMGARIVDVAEMELALAHLGVPETV